MMTSKVTRVALAGAAAAMLSLGASSAMAQPNKCQSVLEKNAGSLSATVVKSLDKCVDAVRKAIDKAVPVDQAVADSCNKALQKSADTRAKLLGKCQASTKCTAADLELLGHPVSGLNAPAAPTAIDFACRFVLERAESLAVSTVFAANPSAQAQLGLASQGGTGLVDTVFAGSPSCNTYACKMPPNDGNPATGNVYLLSPNINPAPPYAIPLDITGAVLFDVCSSGGVANSLILGGEGAKGLPPTNLGGPIVCSTTVNAEGFCACAAGTGAQLNYVACRDSVITDGDECPSGGIVISDDPGSTVNGPLEITYAGAAGAGDCVGFLATAFKTVLPGQQGPDGVFCTPDDLAAVLPATPIPFTTGVTSGTILDANGTDGLTITSSVLPAAARTGAPVSSCANLQAANLSPLALSGAGIAMDGGATGDAVIQLRLACQP